MIALAYRSTGKDSGICVAYVLRELAHCGWSIQVIYPLCMYGCHNLVFQFVS
jgi:hypothetical protein